MNQRDGEGIQAFSVRCDIAKNADVEAAIEQSLTWCHLIDELINDAGATWAPFEDRSKPQINFFPPTSLHPRG